jgi:hypothetical protein
MARAGAARPCRGRRRCRGRICPPRGPHFWALGPGLPGPPKPTCTAGYFCASRATPRRPSPRSSAPRSGSAGHSSSDGAWPAVNGSPARQTCASESSSGSSPRFRHARQPMRPRADSASAAAESRPSASPSTCARRSSHGMCAGDTSPTSPRPWSSALWPAAGGGAAGGAAGAGAGGAAAAAAAAGGARRARGATRRAARPGAGALGAPAGRGRGRAGAAAAPGRACAAALMAAGAAIGSSRAGRRLRLQTGGTRQKARAAAAARRARGARAAANAAPQGALRGIAAGLTRSLAPARWPRRAPRGSRLLAGAVGSGPASAGTVLGARFGGGMARASRRNGRRCRGPHATPRSCPTAGWRARFVWPPQGAPGAEGVTIAPCGGSPAAAARRRPPSPPPAHPRQVKSLPLHQAAPQGAAGWFIDTPEGQGSAGVNADGRGRWSKGVWRRGWRQQGRRHSSCMGVGVGRAHKDGAGAAMQGRGREGGMGGVHVGEGARIGPRGRRTQIIKSNRGSVTAARALPRRPRRARPRRRR